MNEPVNLLDLLQGYGDIFRDAAYLLIVGIVGVFLLHRLAKRFIFPHFQSTRLLTVVFTMLYLVVLVVTSLLTLEALGYDVDAAAELVILLLVVVATLLFLILPYLPTLPYRKGDVVDIAGTFGAIETVTAFQTKILTFDGKLISLLNSRVLASNISNYYATPTLRVELTLELNPQSNVEQAVTMLERVLVADERILESPASGVYVLNVDPQRIKVTGFGWTTNENWFRTRSDLWIQVLRELESSPGVSLALPKREIHLAGNEVRGFPPARDEQ
ncbi:mechanosensitive ion channel family protein [Pseudomonadota bacterium]